MAADRTTDAIKIQLQNLIPCHRYRAAFKLHNITGLEAYLDREQLEFTASSDKQNFFVLLTKDVNALVMMLEVITTDLDENISGSTSMFLQCPEFDTCNLTSE